MSRFNLASARVRCLSLALGGALALSACSDGARGEADPARTDPTLSGSVAEKYSDYFPIGAAVGSWNLDHTALAVTRDFNHLTAENAMKAQNIHPAEDTYVWTEADRIADFARSHGMKMTGHALLWHRQAPDWLFQGVSAGDAAGLELLKARLKAHIEALVNRYADVVDNWDVVNEAISNYPDNVYRDGSEGSRWYELFGSEEYIYWAYRYTRDALETIEPGSSQGKLYYNEYTVTQKADKILTMFAWLEGRGIHVDGVGFQSHEYMDWPSAGELQEAFDKFVAAGYQIKISELDVTVYDDYTTGSFVALPEVPYTPDLEAAQAQRFVDLFSVYRNNKGSISSVTFWGVTDDHSWLNYQPVFGRADYPLLYKDANTAKAARLAIMNF
ncbi:MAG TPA: endo-1,4-beta-xylanase [Polyangiaceae bacterium]|nr:endo-1,4-beta-xylanase [Polyangiaceae bacterium]